MSAAPCAYLENAVFDSHIITTMTFFNLLLLPTEAGLLLLVLYFVANEVVRWQARLKGLPGPRAFPVIGNLPQVGRTESAYPFHKQTKY